MSNGMPYTVKMLATISRRNEDIVTSALKIFEQFGMVEIVNDAVTIPNWGKHQKIEAIEQNREYHRKYMQEYREKQKQLPIVATTNLTIDELKSPLNLKYARIYDRLLELTVPIHVAGPSRRKDIFAEKRELVKRIFSDE